MIKQVGDQTGKSQLTASKDETGSSVRALCSLILRSAIGLAISSDMIFSGFIAKADVIAERKANFRASAAAMRAINIALGDGDFGVVITQVTTIAGSARVMPDDFPENNQMGNTTARADIWIDFDGF